MSLLEMPSMTSENRPPTRDGQRCISPVQDLPPTGHAQRLTSPVPTEESNGTAHANLERPSSTSAGFSHLSLSDATSREVFSYPHTSEHQALEQSPIHLDFSPEQSPKQLDFSPEQSPKQLDFLSEQSPKQLDFLSEQMNTDCEFSSQTSRDRLVEPLPGVSYRGKGEHIENEMMNQRGQNTRPELSKSSRTRDNNVYRDNSDQQLLQGTQETLEELQGLPNSVNTSIHYHTIYNISKSAPNIAHSKRHQSNSSYVEQQSVRSTPDHEYKETHREEAIKIKRPRDYKRQWRDSIDRLSTVSVTDDSGTPVSPLISHYKISLAGRSKSLDADGFRGIARSKWDNYPLTQRSRSSHVLSTAGGSSHVPVDSSNTSQAQRTGERTMSRSIERNIPAEVGPGDFYRRGHLAAYPVSVCTAERACPVSVCTAEPACPVSVCTAEPACPVSVCTAEPRVPDKSETNLVRGTTLAKLPPFTSNKEHSHLSHSLNEQSILKNQFRSESSPSGSRVQIRQHNYEPAGYQRLSSRAPVYDAPVLTTSYRHHSLSPQRKTVGSHAHSTARPSADRAWESDCRFSVPATYRPATYRPATYRPATPQMWPTVETSKQADRNIHVSISHEALSQLAETVSQQGINDLNVRVTFTDERPSQSHSVSPVVGLVENSQIGYMSSHPHLENHYIDNLEDRRGCSPPSRRGGAGRVPRREAWEQERRHRNEDKSVGRDDGDSESGIVDGLFQEIEILREKVDLLERDDSRSRFGRETQPEFVSNKTKSVISPMYRRVQGNRELSLLSDHISTPARTGHGRALSCPLLKQSRRSPATRSVSRTAGNSGSAEIRTTLDGHAANLGLLTSNFSHDTNQVTDPNKFNIFDQSGRQSMNYNQKTHTTKCEVYGGDSGRSFEPRHVVKWKQLISRHDLSKLEVIELKQALACVLVENDILLAKLNSARQEVHDKLRHTNSVLEDCRQHLAQSQAENMQFRVMLKEEQRSSHAHRSGIAELEDGILKVKTDNQQLQQELDHTAMLLDDSENKSQAQIDDLKAENWKLKSRLTCVEQENDDLREEVELLTKKQTKAMDTMDGLRKCLARTRQERQELFEELATFKDHEQRNKVGEFIKNYQEKGSEDEWEKEPGQEGETQRSGVSYANGGSQRSRDLNPSSSQSPLPRTLSKSTNSSTVHDRGNEHLQRRGHIYHKGKCSPQHGRSSSLPGYSHLLSMDKSIIDPYFLEMKRCVPTSRTTVDSGFQFSRPRLDRSRSPGRYRSLVSGSCTPRHEEFGSPKGSCNSTSSSVQHGLTRSLPSPGHWTLPPSQHTYHPYTTTDNRRDRQAAENRNKSLSFAGYNHPDCSFSESDAEDTGINSSMSSRSSYENLLARKRAPLLTREQRQYADHLVQKYTGQISHKQPAKKVVVDMC